jgi:hypothetical protein
MPMPEDGAGECDAHDGGWSDCQVHTAHQKRGGVAIYKGLVKAHTNTNVTE